MFSRPARSFSSSAASPRFNPAPLRCKPAVLDRPIVRTQLPRAYSSFAEPAKLTSVNANASFLEEQYYRWAQDSSAVDAALGSYFAGVRASSSYRVGPAAGTPGTASGAVTLDSQAVQEIIRDHMKVVMLIRAYQVRGHHMANLDPLKLPSPKTHYELPPPPECQLDYYGLGEGDLNRQFYIGTGVLKGFLSGSGAGAGVMSLREIMAALKAAYCGTIGLEYMHIADRDQCNWLRDRFEKPRGAVALSPAVQISIYERLRWAAGFEAFLAVKYGKAEKRFGLEGCEALIPAMQALVDRASEKGVEQMVFGMPHRGRLNVLANVLQKPYETIFAEFAGFSGECAGSGDVKYHLGMSVERPSAGGKNVHLTLVANPSHLEAVNPVVEGKARAKQFYMKDTGRGKVLSVLLHGDAAFSGQGVVYETMGFSDLYDYTTGGTVHIIVNNQIGFTADPRDCRSSPYCSDLAKAFQAPILHVNGDDPEAVVWTMQLAADWRQQFKKDVVIDIVCYRRHGHNEGDEPLFTQPLMYKKIAKHASTLDIYEEKLLKSGVLTPEKRAALVKEIHDTFTAAFERATAAVSAQKAKEAAGRSSGSAPAASLLPSPWVQGGEWAALAQAQSRPQTGVPVPQLKKIGTAFATLPAKLEAHKGIQKVFQQRLEMFSKENPFDWATAEGLAFGTLLAEGVHVRLSGQDVERGTFSHRHAVVVDQNTQERHVPLNHLTPTQASFSVSNSHLSEFGVLGFELGYSMENPRSLVCWEAQFGDFANGAQIIIDQFIVAGEKKWERQSGLTMLLPHAYEGAGPEHSSCRIERFLQSVDEDADTFQADWEAQLRAVNMWVGNFSTPANYFHALRRQVGLNYRKPLVVATPKALLRLEACRSKLTEIGEGTQLLPVIGEQSPTVAPAAVKRVAVCSGHLYYVLRQHQIDQKLKTPIAFVRLEQFAPFPFSHLAAELAKYPNAEMMFVQEEPKNMGAWSYAEPRLRATMARVDQGRKGSARQFRYVGRAAAASTATGFKTVHKQEVVEIEGQVFGPV